MLARYKNIPQSEIIQLFVEEIYQYDDIHDFFRSYGYPFYNSGDIPTLDCSQVTTQFTKMNVGVQIGLLNRCKNSGKIE